jgi:hypothetical protein
LTSLADVTADVDDSVLTTASTMTTASKGAKKTTKGKKAAAATTKTRKTRTKKDEAVEVPEDEPEQEVVQAPPSPAKPARGRKRLSEELEDAALINAEAPAPKKRTKATKARSSTATEASSVDAEMVNAPEPAKRLAVKKARKASGTRKASGSQHTRELSTASVDSLALAAAPNDDEIDRQLEADLERPLSDDEDILADPNSKEAVATRMEVVAKHDHKANELTHTATTDFAMFDPTPAEPTDAQVAEDLKKMEDEMDLDHKDVTEEVAAPKKGRKAGTRKVSRQTGSKKVEEAVLPVAVEQSQSCMDAEAEEPDEIAEADVSFGSNGTVVRRSLSRTSLARTSLGSVMSTASTKGTAKRGRPPKKSKVPEVAKQEPAPVPVVPDVATIPSAEPTDVQATLAPPLEGTKKRTSTAKRGRPPKNPKPTDAVPEMPPHDQAAAGSEARDIVTDIKVESATVQESFSAATSSPRIARKPVPAPKDSPFAIRKDELSASVSVSNVLAVPPKTPRHHASPAQSAKQATISPSPSPQASDAENRPPSSKPNTASSKGKRMPPVVLPAAATPPRQMSPSKQVSPSKQNAIGSLQSAEPWTAIDLDSIFGGFHNDQEDVNGAAERFFAQGGELTEQERNMTVEEWIYYNAGKAEEKLKFECESMVMLFEKEGTRAMRALEGLVVSE